MTLVLLALLGCKATPEPDPSPLLGVPEGERFALDGLNARALVVFTEAGVPHVYATDREDLARVQGFVVARDRFFMMDMGRRLSTGTVSELFGDLTLEADMEARGISQTWIVDQLVANLTDDQAILLDAYAAGINAYIEAVREERLDPPSEYAFAAKMLGFEEPIDAMQPFARRDVVALLGTILFRLGYEGHEVGRTRDFARLEGLFAEAPKAELRQAGVYTDIWDRTTPVYPVSSAPDWDPQSPPPPRRSAPPAKGPHVPGAVLDRLAERLDRIEARHGRDRRMGWGSNAWAVAGTHTADGRALLAGDGHLELVLPSLLYQVGLDTAHLGGGEIHQAGHLLLATPFMTIGTNGDVAWSTTQLMGDITDWYVEELQLEGGLPAASRFDGQWEPLIAAEETFVVADVPLLDSVGRTVKTTRWTTFDGRWLAEVEGRRVSEDEPLADGEARINLQGAWVVPSDTDGDGVITAVSFDFTGLDRGNLFSLIDAWGHAGDVDEFHEATARALALSQNVMAADSSGNIYYSGYQPVPCRGYLDREADGSWAPGANPQMLLDGTRYGGFTIPTDEDFRPIEGDPDPYRCVVPQAEYPHAKNPAQGYLVTANNDIGNLSLDGSLTNDKWYVGGPWTEGYRADGISRKVESAIEAGADVAAMAAIQGDRQSLIGRQMSPYLLEALDRAEAAAGGAPDPDSADARLASLWTANSARFTDARARLRAWADADYPTPSGVETFYDDGGDPAHAVATMIHNTWMGDFVRDTLDDEGIPGGAWFPTGATGRLRLLTMMLESRGENPHDLASWDEETGESVYFDVKSTPEHETSDELLVGALVKALDFLASPGADDSGGFGTPDMDAWVWGLRHQVKLQSLLGGYVDDPTFAVLLQQFDITTDVLPLADGLPPTDPRAKLTWFPRGGDNLGIDAANNGLSGRGFQYGSGPIMRMVYALGEGVLEGQDVIPGGQSGLVDSPNFADQAALWLANEALPVRFTVDDVVAHGEERWTFTP